MINRLLAQDIDWTNVGTAYRPLTQIAPSNYIAALINIGLIAIVIIVFLFLLIGGFRWITSKGEKEGLVKSQKTISGALIGLIIALSIFLILGLLAAFFRINLLQFCIPGVTASCNITYTPPVSPPGSPPGVPPGSPPVPPVGIPAPPGSPLPPGTTVGVNCGCGGGTGPGQCALINAISTVNFQCYQCTATQWSLRSDLTYPTDCNPGSPINCYPCP